MTRAPAGQSHGHLPAFEPDALSPEQARELMDKRARRVAEPPPAPVGDMLPFVTFSLGAERYALPLRDVIEVARVPELTSLPGSKDIVTGLIALRGEIIPVLDLARLLGVTREAKPASPRAIILGDERADIAVIADAVGEVSSLRAIDLLPAPASIRAGRSYIRGVTRDTVTVLSGAELLGDTRLFEGL